MKREDDVEDGWRRWRAYKMEEDGGVYVEGRRWHVQSWRVWRRSLPTRVERARTRFVLDRIVGRIIGESSNLACIASCFLVVLGSYPWDGLELVFTLMTTSSSSETDSGCIACCMCEGDDFPDIPYWEVTPLWPWENHHSLICMISPCKDVALVALFPTKLVSCQSEFGSNSY